MRPAQIATPEVVQPARGQSSGRRDVDGRDVDESSASEAPRSVAGASLFHDTPGLLLAFREGKREALEVVYRHYVRAIDCYFGALARWAGCLELAQSSVVQDLLQETFIRAFSSGARRGYDESRDFLPYLKTIARNCFIDQLRKRRHELPLVADEPPLSLEAPPRDHEYDPEVLAALEAYLRALPPVLKEVYEQRFELGLSQETACENLGLSRRTLRTHEDHLRRGLRKALFKAGLLHDAPRVSVATLVRGRP